MAGELHTITLRRLEEALTNFWIGAKVWIQQNAVSKFKEQIETNVTVGALTAGSTIQNGEEVVNVIKRMVLVTKDAVIKSYPSVKNTGFGAGGTKQIGSSILIKKGVTYTDGKFTSYTSASATQDINAGCSKGTVTYYKGSTTLTIPTSGLTVTLNTTGATTFKVSQEYDSSTTIAKKSDGTNSSISIPASACTDSVTYNVYNTMYFGIGTTYQAAIAEAISGGRYYTTNTVSRTVTCNVTSGNYAWFIMPDRLGTATFKVGGFEGGFEAPTTASITNTSGYSETFKIYRSTNISLGNTTFEITGH